MTAHPATSPSCSLLLVLLYTSLPNQPALCAPLFKSLQWLSRVYNINLDYPPWHLRPFVVWFQLSQHHFISPSSYSASVKLVSSFTKMNQIYSHFFLWLLLHNLVQIPHSFCLPSFSIFKNLDPFLTGLNVGGRKTGQSLAFLTLQSTNGS